MSNNYEWECALGWMISFLGCGRRDNGRHYPAHLPHHGHTSHANIFAGRLPRLIDAVVGIWVSVFGPPLMTTPTSTSPIIIMEAGQLCGN